MRKSFTPASSVYITGSSRHLEDDIVFYRAMSKVVNEKGNTLTSNWVERAYKDNPDGKLNSTKDWGRILDNNISELMSADMIIIEGTHYGFAEGYFTLAALQQKKPVLCVMRDVDLEDRIASGISDKLYSLKRYKTEAELERIVNKFIEENTLTSKDLRFNFFIDNEIYNHLRWASLKTGKTKAEIIRELIEKEIDKKI